MMYQCIKIQGSRHRDGSVWGCETIPIVQEHVLPFVSVNDDDRGGENHDEGCFRRVHCPERRLHPHSVKPTTYGEPGHVGGRWSWSAVVGTSAHPYQ